MKNLAEHIATTHQNEALAGQVPNNDGAYVYKLDSFAQLRRFLILGSEGGTYYAKEREITRENAGVVLTCLKADPKRTFDLITEVSEKALAPKNTPAVFAVALTTTVADPHITQMRRDCFLRVVRTSTHLFEFLTYAQTLRGWGNALKKLTQAWYTSKTRGQLATQFVKYRSREGWSHKDALRLSHVKASTPNNDLRRWVVKNEPVTDDVPRILEGYLKMRDVTTAKDAVALIQEYRLPHEAVPSELQANDAVFAELVKHMPLFATVRQLTRMAARNIFTDTALLDAVCERLVDNDAIVANKLHPANYVLASLMLNKLSNQGTHVPRRLLEAAEDGVIKAFKTIVPSNRRLLVGVDVSGSMTAACGGLPISAREAAAVMAYVLVQSEPDAEVMAFSHTLMPLQINKRASVSSIIRATSGLPFGSTDCSLPIEYASKHQLNVDGFVILTDNETNAYGRPQPAAALKFYNKSRAKPAKMIVQAFTSTGFTVADPADPNMLDVVGLDTAAPALISDFLRDAF